MYHIQIQFAQHALLHSCSAESCCNPVVTVSAYSVDLDMVAHFMQSYLGSKLPYKKKPCLITLYFAFWVSFQSQFYQ